MKSIVKATSIKPPEPTPSIRVTFDLTKYDAEALLMLCTHIGGSPDCSPRHIFDRLSAVLHNKGIRRTDNKIKNAEFSAVGVYFKNYPTFKQRG